MMMNCMNSNNVDLKMIASNVDSLQRDSDVRFKRSCNDKMNTISIINLLTQTSMLKKEKSKDHSWKKVILKLIQHLQNISERKIEKKKVKMHLLQRMYKSWRYSFNFSINSYKHKKICISHLKHHCKSM